LRPKIGGKLTRGGEKSKERKRKKQSGAEEEKCCQTPPTNAKSLRYEPCLSPPVLKVLKSKGRRKLWMHGLGTLLQLLWKELS
jgi:hypothetical protein